MTKIIEGQYSFDTGLAGTGIFFAKSPIKAWNLASEKMAAYKPDSNPSGTLYRFIPRTIIQVTANGVTVTEKLTSEAIMYGEIRVKLPDKESEVKL